MSTTELNEQEAGSEASAPSAGESPTREDAAGEASLKGTAIARPARSWWWLPLGGAAASAIASLLASGTEWASWDAAFFWGYAIAAVPALVLEGRAFMGFLAGDALQDWKCRAEAIIRDDREPWNRAVEQVQSETEDCFVCTLGRYCWVVTSLSVFGLAASAIRLAHAGRGASLGEFVWPWIAACLAAAVTVPGAGVLRFLAKKSTKKASAELRAPATPPLVEAAIPVSSLLADRSPASPSLVAPPASTGGSHIDDGPTEDLGHDAEPPIPAEETPSREPFPEEEDQGEGGPGELPVTPTDYDPAPPKETFDLCKFLDTQDPDERQPTTNAC